MIRRCCRGGSDGPRAPADPCLILPPRPGLVAAGGERGTMRSRAGLALALAAALLVGSCGGSRCPKPIAYDDATLKEVQKALASLPRDSILHHVMADYENERDDLRFCK